MAARAGPPTNGVFINCPFDDEYAPVFRALIFALHACKFAPRSARELDDAGQTRIDKLYTIIEDCRYGIHDLSRTELDAAHRLPRFNMPLELGIFLGARRFGNEEQARKRTLILDIEQYRYQRFISDLAGMDIHAHGGDPDRAITEMRDWLANVSRRKLPSGVQLVRIHAQFLAELPAIAAELEFDPAGIPMWISSGSWWDGWWRRRRPEQARPVRLFDSHAPRSRSCATERCYSNSAIGRSASYAPSANRNRRSNRPSRRKPTPS